MSAAYTDPRLVGDVFADAHAPRYGQTVTGYGGKIPTRYRVTYAGRVRRVYVMQYGNAGSAYVIVGGADVFLDSDTEHACMAAGASA